MTVPRRLARDSTLPKIAGTGDSLWGVGAAVGVCATAGGVAWAIQAFHFSPFAGSDAVLAEVANAGQALGLLGLAGLAFAFLRQRGSLRRAETKPRQADAELFAQERYRHSFQNAAVGLAHFALDGRLLDINAKFCAQFGYSAEEIAAMKDLDLTLGDDRSIIAADLEALRSGRVRQYSGERQYVAKTGEVVPVRTSMRLVGEPNDPSSFYMMVVENLAAKKAAEKALHESEERFRLAMKGANEGVWDWNIITDRTYYSPRWKSMLGYGEDEIDDTVEASLQLASPESRALIEAKIADIEAGVTEIYEAEIKLRHKDGRWIDILSRAFPVFDENHKMIRLVGTHLDITERRKQDRDLRRAAAVYSSTHDGIVVTDADGIVEMVNPAFVAITGYTEAEIVGRRISTSDPSRHPRRDLYVTMSREVLEHGRWQGEVWNLRKDGSSYPEWVTVSAVRNAEGALVNYVSLRTDISKLKESEARFAFLAHHDPLTSLPNRTLLRQRIEQARAAKPIEGEGCALLFLDLDRFKTINDSLGHAIGDELLVLATERWKKRLRPCDVLARLGGDEFVVLLQPASSREFAYVAAQGLIAEMAQPFIFADGREAYVGLSIGIAMFGEDDESPDTLIQQADSALYAAKRNGGGVRFYSVKQTLAAQERVKLEAGLRHGLERGEFALQYQPLIDLADRRAFGAEALVRWLSPAGLVPPAQFIPLAESTGLIVPLGEWVLREACARMKAWLDAGYDLRSIAVNFSPRQFDQADICERIQAILTQTGLPARYLEIEITESALMEQGAKATAKLEALKALGLRIAVDDFGAGHSSLAYLKKFPIDKLKLDRSFIVDIPADPTSMEIAAAMVRLGHSLKLEVLAEGVETEAQADFLALSGCPSAQGYLFAQPMWEAELLAAFDRRAGRARANAA